MGAAPYQFDLSLSDDATPEFSLEWTMEDGSDFPWAEYTVEYSVHREGWLAWTCGWSTLTEDTGVTVDPSANLVTVTLAQHVRPGQYAHGCRVKHIETGKSVQIFDGTLNIIEGNFR
jgi:hypothetical protein